ncbi:MAG: type VI secretion system protein TssA [Bryobacterales bacterium]|nr:type VI secretion system protein TssA [Bryobacterales bacterium]
MPLRDDLLNPISGDNPSGENLRYAPVYDKIKEARREEDDAPQGEWQRERKVADWPLVIKLAGEALATKSKDLQLAAWLTEAMLRREGFAGFNPCLALMRGLIDNFWDTLYPEVEDGDVELRATPVEWISTKFDDLIRQVPIVRGGHSFLKYKESRVVGYEQDAASDENKAETRRQAIADGKLTADEFDKALESTSLDAISGLLSDIDGCLENIDGLGETCESHFGEFAPTFGRLKETIEEVRAAVNTFYRKKGGGEAVGAEPVETEMETPADSGWGETPVETAAATAPVRARTARRVTSTEPTDLEDAAGRLAAVAKFLRAQDAASPAPYLMLRGFRWGELRAGGSTPDAALLEAPSTETRRALRQLSLDGEWQQALEVAEEAMAEPCGRAWLDLQRYTVRALTELGYPAIADAIRSELRTLLQDLPGLTGMVLMDDTPVGNPETQTWLKDEVQTASAAAPMAYYEPPASSWDSAPSPEGGTGEESVEAPPDAFQLALEAAEQGRFQEGVGILTRELAHEASGRARFQRQLQISQLCIANGREAVALPILEQLVAQIDKHGLEDWEPPDVVARALTLLCACLGRVDRPPEQRQKIYERLCRLSPLQALATAH